MKDDTRPVGYTYDEAAAVLTGLGFSCVTKRGSHRKWRLKRPEGTIVVELVEVAGHLKAYLIRDMITQLRTAGLC